LSGLPVTYPLKGKIRATPGGLWEINHPGNKRDPNMAHKRFTKTLTSQDSKEVKNFKRGILKRAYLY